MNESFIIDAHTHLGPAGQLLCPGGSAADLLDVMDRFRIEASICSDHVALLEGGATGLERMRTAWDESGGRIHALAIFDPRSSRQCLRETEAAVGWAGLAGIKIHPSFHGVPAEDAAYGPIWSFAAASGLPILAHTWSISDTNPAQALANPTRWEGWVREYTGVRLVLGHAGGRGGGRATALRFAREYPNVYLDFAGDIFCHRLIETLLASVPSEKILFGSDYPWSGPADHLSRVLLAPVRDDDKMRILRTNAAAVYRLGSSSC